MATPHTTKYKDEPKIPVTMNPPLGAIMNSAKAQPGASPTTLTPGMEALHLTTISPFTPTTSTTADPLPFKISSEEEYLQVKALALNAGKILRRKQILLFFSAARCPPQMVAAKNLDKSIAKAKDATEMLALSDSEDNDRRMVILLVQANRDFVEAYEGYKSIAEEKGLKMKMGKGFDIWGQEVGEIEGLLGEWEKAWPEGMWMELVERLGELDERIVKEYDGFRSEICRTWGLELDGDESDGAKSDVGKNRRKRLAEELEDHDTASDVGSVARGKSLAEELEELDTASSVGSLDEGDESMEYISPSKVLTEEERDALLTRMENFTLDPEEDEDEVENSDVKSDCKSLLRPFSGFSNIASVSSSPPQLVDLSFTPSRGAARSPGSSPKSNKTLRPVSPVQGKLPLAQSLPVADLPSASFNFTFGPPLPSAKPLQSGQSVSSVTSQRLFGAGVLLDTTIKRSRSLSPVPPAPTAPFVGDFDMNNTMSSSASPLTLVPATQPASAAPSTSFGTANKVNTEGQENTIPEPDDKVYFCRRCKSEWSTLEVLDKRGPEGFLCHKCDYVLVFDHDHEHRGREQFPQSMTALPLPAGNFEFKFGSATTSIRTAPDLSAPKKLSAFDEPSKLRLSNAFTTESSAFSTKSGEKGEVARAFTNSAPKFPVPPSPQPIFGLKPSTPLSTPPITPSLLSFAEANTAPKEARSFANKPPTASTLIELTRALQSVQASVNHLQSALYGFDTTTQAPQTAMDAGLLMMNNFIGEWVDDIRKQMKTLDTKINEIGNLLQGLGSEVSHLQAEKALKTTEAAQEEKRIVQILIEMKEVMAQQMKEKELREQQQSGISTLLAQSAKLAMEVAALKQIKSSVEAEIRCLRADNETFRNLAELLVMKLEAIDRQHAEEEVETEVDEEEDALMQVLWPQGDGRLESELGEGGEKMALERGVLAGAPGFKVPKQELGGKGKPGGGFCSVM